MEENSGSPLPEGVCRAGASAPPVGGETEAQRGLTKLWALTVDSWFRLEALDNTSWCWLGLGAEQAGRVTSVGALSPTCHRWGTRGMLLVLLGYSWGWGREKPQQTLEQGALGHPPGWESSSPPEHQAAARVQPTTGKSLIPVLGVYATRKSAPHTRSSNTAHQRVRRQSCRRSWKEFCRHRAGGGEQRHLRGVTEP